MTHKFIVYGSGGHARELIFQIRQDGHSVAAIVDDVHPGGILDTTPILTTEAANLQFSDADWLVAIGSPTARRRVTAELAEVGIPMGRFVSSKATIAPSAKLGDGVQVFANAVISDKCRVGAGVIVHFGAIICHDSSVGDYSIICPGASIAGNVAIGSDVWFGVGASSRNGMPANPLTIGDGAFVGAGACVVSTVAAGATVVGVPARVKQP